jgi:hypothetical protein
MRDDSIDSSTPLSFPDAAEIQRIRLLYEDKALVNALKVFLQWAEADQDAEKRYSTIALLQIKLAASQSAARLVNAVHFFDTASYIFAENPWRIRSCCTWIWWSRKP